MTIAFGVCVGRSAHFNQTLQPSLERFAPGSPVLTRRDQKAIATAYNSLVAEAAALPDLEFLVLLHDDVELTADLLPALRAARATVPETGVLGTVGGLGFRGARWWLTPERRGSLVDGQLTHAYSAGTTRADSVDGLLLAFPSDVLPLVRFDERYRGFHLYDADICRQLGEAGRPAVVADLPVVHHSKAGFGSAGAFYREEVRYLRKWRLWTHPRGAVDLANAALRIVWCTVRHRVLRGRP